MKFKGKIAPGWYVVTGVINGLAIAAIIHYGGYGPYVTYLPLTAFIDLYLIPVYFRNYVVIDKDFITVHFGLLKKVVMTKDVLTIQSSNSMSSSFSASFDRLAIKPKNKTVVYIALEDKQGFVKELMKLNKKVKYFG